MPKNPQQPHNPAHERTSAPPTQTAPNPAKASTTTTGEPEKQMEGKTIPQPAIYKGLVVAYVSRELLLAGVSSGEADHMPAIIARILPRKGPDDHPAKVDLVVIDPERESGTYVERGVLPYDPENPAPGYAMLERPTAVAIPLEALREFCEQATANYLALRDADSERANAIYDEASVRQVVADEVAKLAAAKNAPQRAADSDGKK